MFVCSEMSASSQRNVFLTVSLTLRRSLLQEEQGSVPRGADDFFNARRQSSDPQRGPRLHGHRLRRHLVSFGARGQFLLEVDHSWFITKRSLGYERFPHASYHVRCSVICRGVVGEPCDRVCCAQECVEQSGGCGLRQREDQTRRERPCPTPLIYCGRGKRAPNTHWMLSTHNATRPPSLCQRERAHISNKREDDGTFVQKTLCIWAFYLSGCESLCGLACSFSWLLNTRVFKLKPDMSSQLLDHCLAPDTSGDGTGCDNMTCIIITLRPHPSPGQPDDKKKRKHQDEAEGAAEPEKNENNSKKAKSD